MKDLYFDKKDRVRAWFTPVRIATCSVLAFATLFIPLWPDWVRARFVLEPARRVVIRAQVSGVVSQVLAEENQAVTPGTPVVRLRNLALKSEAEEANARFHEASARAINAGLHYSDFGHAERERQESAERNRVLEGELTHLEVSSPIAGVVVTPRLRDLLGSYVDAGRPLAEVANLDTMTARIYIPEFGVRDVHPGMAARLQFQSRFLPISGTLASVAPLSSTLDPGLAEREQLSGIVPPPFYVGLVNLRNDGTLWDGMTGTAKLFVRYRSLAAMMGRYGRDLFQRRFW